MLVERQEVVVVAADFPRRLAVAGEREAGHPQRSLWQQRHLDLARDLQFLLEPLLLGLLLQQVLDARGHRVERIGELAELIARADRYLVREVALPHALGAGEEVVDRPGDRARERQPHAERHHLDDEEQPADQAEQDEEHLAEAEVAIGVIGAAEIRS